MAKYTSGRQKNLKVGISSHSEELTSLEVIGNVGIGTTTATSKLSVEGNAYFSGIVTAKRLISSVYGEFTGGAISGTSIAGIALSISGISTFTNGPVLIGSGTSTGIESQKLQVTGDAYVSNVTSTNSLSIGSTQVISSSRQLQNIASLDATTTTTIEEAIANAPNTFIDLQVTGISTFTNGPVLIGSGTSTTTTLQQLQVTGGAYISNNAGIGTTNPTSKLQVEGDVFVSGIITSTDFNSASDINLKKNIKPFENALDKIIQINGVTFEWKTTNSQSAGIIAQDVEKVFPELVRDGNFKTVNYNGLIGVLVESIKELKQEIEELKRKINN